MSSSDEREALWLGLHVRSGMTRLLLNAAVPKKVRAVSLDISERLVHVYVYVWPPVDEEVHRFFAEEIIPQYTSRFEYLGIPGAALELEYIEYDGPGNVGGEAGEEDPPGYQRRGRQVWCDATMLRPGVLDDEPPETIVH